MIVAAAALFAGQLQLRHARHEREATERSERRRKGATVVAPLISLLSDADPQRLNAPPGTQALTVMLEVRERWHTSRDQVLVFAARDPSRQIADAADKVVLAVSNALTTTHWLIHDLPVSWSTESLETARADNAEALTLTRALLELIRIGPPE